MLGRHSFTLPEAVARDELRPLRDPRQTMEEAALARGDLLNLHRRLGGIVDKDDTIAPRCRRGNSRPMTMPQPTRVNDSPLPAWAVSPACLDRRADSFLSKPAGHSWREGRFTAAARFKAA
jgi:hypothetical protein